MPRLKGRLRPVNAVGPIAGSVFTVLAWAAIAHNSGSGWVQALGAMLGAVLLVGILAPGFVVSRTGVAVESAPADGVAGEPLDIELAATTRIRVRPVTPPGKTGFVGPINRGRSGRDDPHDRMHEPADMIVDGSRRSPAVISVVPTRRGMLGAIQVEIASAAPFGILWWSRRSTLEIAYRDLYRT